MLFFRIFQHLLPRAEAWRLTIEKTLRKFFEGLGNSFTDLRQYLDLVWLDQFAATTRELEESEFDEGLFPPASKSVADRRTALATERAAPGGQSPSYIQSRIQEAFPQIYIHQWWSSGPPYVARDPRAYTTNPLIGQYQCGSGAFEYQCSLQREINGTPIEQPQCSNLLLNDPGYLVNEDLTGRPPPPVPDNPKYWPYFLYFCDETFGEPAIVPTADLPELKRLLLRHCPTQHWIVLITEPNDPGSAFFYFAAPGDSGNGFNNDPWRTYS